MKYENLESKIYTELNISHAIGFINPNSSLLINSQIRPIPLPQKIPQLSQNNFNNDSVAKGFFAYQALINEINLKKITFIEDKNDLTFLENLLLKKIQAGSGNMSDVGKYASITRKWQRWLIEEITEVALEGIEKSRTNVKNWQISVFGQSLSNNDLNRYADSSRKPGDRVKKIDHENYESQNAKKIFDKYKNILENVSKSYGHDLPRSVGNFLFNKNKDK